MQIRFSAQPAVSTFGAPAKPSATAQTLTPTPPDQISIRFGNQSKPDYSAQTSEIANQIAAISIDNGPLATAKRERLYKQLLAPLYLDRPDAGYLSALEDAALDKKVTISDIHQELLLVHLEGNQPAIQTALFFHAAQTGDKARLGTLLKKNPDLINAQGPRSGNTALIHAAWSGHTEVVKALVEAGAKLDIQDKYGNTALSNAAWSGHTEVVKALVEAGAKLDIQNENGHTALIFGADKGHTEVVKALVEAGAKLDIQNKNGHTALIHAAWSGHTEAVKALVDAEAKLDIQDKNGHTALYWSATGGHTEVVKYLKEAGAKLDIQNEDGDKPDQGAQTPEQPQKKKRWWQQ